MTGSQRRSRAQGELGTFFKVLTTYQSLHARTPDTADKRELVFPKLKMAHIPGNSLMMYITSCTHSPTTPDKTAKLITLIDRCAYEGGLYSVPRVAVEMHEQCPCSSFPLHVRIAVFPITGSRTCSPVGLRNSAPGNYRRHSVTSTMRWTAS